MDLDVLGFGLFGNEDVGEDDSDGEENDDDNQALTQPTLNATHPFNATEFLFLGATYLAFRVMMTRHFNNGQWKMDNGELFQDGIKQGGEGDEDAGTSKPEARGVSYIRVTRLYLVGLHIDNVVLLEIVVW